MDGDDVGGATLFDEAADVAEDAPMLVAVEVVGTDEIGDAIPGGIVEEQPAEQRLFSFERVRR